MNYVVGSGPAGVAAAHALLARGERVTLVDAGLTLEPEREAILQRLRGSGPAEWAAEDLASIKHGIETGTGGVILKRVFGSDFPYRGSAEHLAFQSADSALLPSLAQGGLSNVWGAAMLPYRDADLADWPLTAADLAPHYRAILELTGLAAQADDLAELLPLHTADCTPLPMSRQAATLWRALEHGRTRLRRHGFRWGAARLAVQARRAPDEPGCIACGLCMYGCPYGYIYSSSHTLHSWRERENFTYEPGIIVERAEETPAGITLKGHSLNDRRPWSVTGERVFLGAGVLPSTQILLSSLGAYEQSVPILDSQYFLFPWLQMQAAPRVREEALYTLSQIFLELLDPALSPHTIHLQLYSYNDLIGGALRSSLGPLGFEPLVRALENRLLVAQGYLHSSHSGRLRAELRGSAGAGRLQVQPDPANPADTSRIRGVVRKLARHAWALRALPLEPLLKIPPPGRGFHSGGSFPMRREPGAFETDRLGRPSGFTRLHVVDSSVFPSIPATTITFSVMANAHRIASESAPG